MADLTFSIYIPEKINHGFNVISNIFKSINIEPFHPSTGDVRSWTDDGDELVFKINALEAYVRDMKIKNVLFWSSDETSSFFVSWDRKNIGYDFNLLVPLSSSEELLSISIIFIARCLVLYKDYYPDDTFAKYSFERT